MNNTKKTINVLLFILFLIFAIVQLNDPDPYIWFPLYFGVGSICLISNYKIIPNYILLVIVGLLITYSIYHFSLFLTYLKTDHKEELFGEMVYEKPYLEGSREFLGLLLGAVSIYYQLKRKKQI